MRGDAGARSLEAAGYAPFVWSIGIFLASLIGLASSLYPYLVPRSLTAVKAAADSLTLVFMLLGIGLLIPVMIIYNAYQYMVFRGKVTGPLLRRPTHPDCFSCPGPLRKH